MKLDRGASKYAAFGIENPDGLGVVLFNTEKWEGLICPRCQLPVEDGHGMCYQCGENSMQCPQCRNINYNMDSYFCPECGFSKYAKFDFTLVSRSGFNIESIQNEEMKTDQELNLEKVLQNA